MGLGSGLRAREHFVRLRREGRVDHDLVARGEHLVGRREVLAATAQREGRDGEQHSETGADHDRGHGVREIRRRREEKEQDAEEESEPGAACGTGGRAATVALLAGDALDSRQVMPDYGELLDLEICFRQPVDDLLGFEVRLVGAEYISLGDARHDGGASPERALVGHATILPPGG